MAKLKKLNTKDIQPAAFDSRRSFDAAMWAIEICNKIIERYNAGDIVFEYENIVKPAFELRWDCGGLFDGLYLKDGENTWVELVGDTRHADTPIINDGRTVGYIPGKIVCRKYEIREYFKLWRVAKITDVNRVTDLTK